MNNKLKIAQFNRDDIQGGAAKASYRLYTALKNSNLHINYFVKNKSMNETNIIKLEQSKNNIKNFESVINFQYINKNRTSITNTLFSFSHNDSILPNLLDFDIINLHWIEFFLSFENIYTLCKTNIPIVWTLHDMRPFTGGCHYSANCEGFKKECLNCEQLSEDKLSLTNKNLMLKKKILKNANITIVTPSNWLAKEVKKSFLFKDKKVEVIPNSVDSNIFQAKDKNQAKEALGIPKDSIVLGFGVLNHNEKRKGFEELLLAIKRIETKLKEKKVIGLFFGESNLKDFPIPIINNGYISDEEELSLTYSALDIFILPSLEDNLPNTILESLSCQTPIIAFDTGGIRDIVSQENGILVERLNIPSLSNAILELVENKELRQQKGQKGRELIIKNYQLETQAKKYLNLYKELKEEKSNYNESININEKVDPIIGHILRNYSLYPEDISIDKQKEIFLKNFRKLYTFITSLEKNETYLIYGAGTVGEFIKSLLPSQNFITFVDNSSQLISKTIKKEKIYSPKNIPNILFDKIIISVLGKEEEIEAYLINSYKVKKNKVIRINLN